MMYVNKVNLSTLVVVDLLEDNLHTHVRPTLCRSERGLRLRRPSGLATAARRQLNNQRLLTSIKVSN